MTRVVIVGGGFGGLYAAKKLAKCKEIELTIIDKRNFHLFQPLLYQVASGGLSPGDVASPIRGIFAKFPNVRVILGEAKNIDPKSKQLEVNDETLAFDYLILATGATHSYFGKREWEQYAPGLKTIEDALDMRRRILSAFEQAELEKDPKKQAAWLRFTVVGAGPTGVELAGAIGELAHTTMKKDFRAFKPQQVEIRLVEAGPQILNTYTPNLAKFAEKTLNNLGVTVQTNTRVSQISQGKVTLQEGDSTTELECQTILWAAGVQASPLGKALQAATGCELDRQGKVVVNEKCQIPNVPHVFVIGDLAHYTLPNGKVLPGVAPVAMQQGSFAARWIRAKVRKKTEPKFKYRDKGNLAVLGRHAAIADINGLRFKGFPAWLVWALVHIHFLIEFDSKILVSLQWAWNFFTRKKGARLIGSKPAVE